MFVLIWRGWGLIVLFFIALGVVAGIGIKALVDPARPDGRLFTGFGCMISGVICTVVGAYLHKRHAAGERHDLFFIPVIVWGPMIILLGMAMMLRQ